MRNQLLARTFLHLKPPHDGFFPKCQPPDYQLSKCQLPECQLPKCQLLKFFILTNCTTYWSYFRTGQTDPQKKSFDRYQAFCVWCMRRCYAKAEGHRQIDNFKTYFDSIEKMTVITTTLEDDSHKPPRKLIEEKQYKSLPKYLKSWKVSSILRRSKLSWWSNAKLHFKMKILHSRHFES